MPHNLRSKYEHAKGKRLKSKQTVAIIYFAEFGHAQLIYFLLTLAQKWLQDHKYKWTLWIQKYPLTLHKSISNYN